LLWSAHEQRAKESMVKKGSNLMANPPSGQHEKRGKRERKKPGPPGGGKKINKTIREKKEPKDG